MKQIMFILLFFQSVFVYSQRDSLNIIIMINRQLLTNASLHFFSYNDDKVDTIHSYYQPGYVSLNHEDFVKLKSADSIIICYCYDRVYDKGLKLKFPPNCLNSIYTIYSILEYKKDGKLKYDYEYESYEGRNEPSYFFFKYFDTHKRKKKWRWKYNEEHEYKSWN